MACLQSPASPASLAAPLAGRVLYARKQHAPTKVGG